MLLTANLIWMLLKYFSPLEFHSATNFASVSLCKFRSAKECQLLERFCLFFYV